MGVSHASCSEEGKTIAQAVEVSKATDSNIDIPCPSGKDYLGYQKAGISYALGRKSTLIADEMGLGKTIQAIGFINSSPDIRRVLVVCPASLKLNWRNELSRWLTRSMTIAVYPWSKNGYGLAKDGFIDIINYDMLKKLPDSAYDLVIFDEAHYAKNPKAARTKLCQAIAKRAKHVLALTGTPILNKPIELFPILQMVNPETWDPPGFMKGKQLGAGEGAGFFRFAKRYCNAHQERVRT
jgi:SWI/SNF-related matrix-associated actin-dependent regulator 1 of chromatin subfamily A